DGDWRTPAQIGHGPVDRGEPAAGLTSDLLLGGLLLGGLLRGGLLRGLGVAIGVVGHARALGIGSGGQLAPDGQGVLSHLADLFPTLTERALGRSRGLSGRTIR